PLHQGRRQLADLVGGLHPQCQRHPRQRLVVSRPAGTRRPPGAGRSCLTRARGLVSPAEYEGVFMRCSSWMGLGRLAVSLALGVVLGVAGCAVGGSGTGTVTGKVMYKGAPLKGGNVYFFVDDKNPGIGEIQEDGTYRAEKVPIGVAKVGVDTESLKPPMGMPA